MRTAIRWSGLVGLMALVAWQALPARAADGPVSAIFQRVEAAGRASLEGLQVLPVVAPGALSPAISIRCDFSCAFPGFCFKYVDRNVKLDLSPYRTNHTTYTRAVLETLSGDVPRVRQSTAEATNQLKRLDRAAAQLKDATTEGMSSAETEFRRALGSAIVGTHDLREQALRAALALEGRTNQLGSSPEFSRNDTDRWIRDTKAQHQGRRALLCGTGGAGRGLAPRRPGDDPAPRIDRGADPGRRQVRCDRPASAVQGGQ